MTINSQSLQKSIENLLQWSQDNHHQLPWRKKRTLYGTLVSEIMLQQTTVGTVLNHFEKFMKRFPTIQSLAVATDEELAVEWKGLGYYRRAKNLKSCASEITEIYKGKIPLEREQLLQIKGIGEYTASALLAIGAGKKDLAIDANLERVIARLYSIKTEKGLKLQKEIRKNFIEEKLLKLKNFNEWRELNEALMDLGRVYCKARKVYCNSCPLNSVCLSKKNNDALDYPVQKQLKSKLSFHELHLLRIIYKQKNSLAVYKKAAHEWLSDQWEVPTLVISTDDLSLKQYPSLNKIQRKQVSVDECKKFKTSITKYKITNYIYEVKSHEDIKKLGFTKEIEFHRITHSANFSTATFKLLQLLENKK